MIKFEVYIPGITEDDFDITLKIKAKSWIEALKIGLNRLGEDAKIIKNLMIDIMDDESIHVTETVNNRVFRIKELVVEEEPKPVIEAKPVGQVKPIVAQKLEPITEPKPVIEAKPVIKTKPVVAQKLEPITEPKPKKPLKNRFEEHFDIEDEVKVKTDTTQKITLGRQVVEEKINVEEILSDLYFDISDIDNENNVLNAMEIVMDLTMKYMNSESGSVYLVDMNKNDIIFAAIRGPKAEDLKKLNLRIPMGMGIVGFCVEENVSIAISEVNRDPRFYRAISQKLGYPTYSILSIPIYKSGRVYGAIQLINKKSSSKFTTDEISVIDYIANHAAQYLERKHNKF